MKRVLAVLGIALAAVLAIGGGYAMGSTSKPKLDTACVSGSHRVVHLFARAGTCPLGQHRIQWNVQGPRGLRGPAGPGVVSNIPSPVGTLGNGVFSVTAKCPASSPRVVSGGYTFMTSNEQPVAMAVSQDGPVRDGSPGNFANAWTVAVPPFASPSGQSGPELAVSIVCS
jgi:hypothetical protein